MTTQNKRKLAALTKENCEEHPRSNVAQNSNVFRSQEDYIAYVSEEIEGRVTKKLSQEFSRTENRILGALVRLDDFLMNPLLQGYSGTAPEASRNALSTSQGTNEDDCQNDPHPEAGFFHSQMMQSSGPEEGHDSWASERSSRNDGSGKIITHFLNPKTRREKVATYRRWKKSLIKQNSTLMLYNYDYFDNRFSLGIYDFQQWVNLNSPQGICSEFCSNFVSWVVRW